jgi:hypothetical protein
VERLDDEVAAANQKGDVDEQRHNEHRHVVLLF